MVAAIITPHFALKSLFKTGERTRWPFHHPLFIWAWDWGEETEGRCTHELSPLVSESCIMTNAWCCLHFGPQRVADSVGAGPESLCSMAGGAGGGRRLILSLFKITSTHCAESLERHCLGFCISLKNIPLQSFPSSEAHPFPHSGPLKGSCVDPVHGYSLSRAWALPLHLPDNSDAARVCSTFTRQPELRGRWRHLPPAHFHIQDNEDFRSQRAAWAEIQVSCPLV